MTDDSFVSIDIGSLTRVNGGAGKGDIIKNGWAWLSGARAPVRGPAGGAHLNESTGAVTTYNQRGLRAKQYEAGHNDPFHPQGSPGSGPHSHTFGVDGSRGAAVPIE